MLSLDEKRIETKIGPPLIMGGFSWELALAL